MSSLNINNLENSQKLFIHKFQALYFDDFEINDDLIHVLKMFIEMDSLNLLLVGGIASGKTSLLNAIIREYYKGFSAKEYSENVLSINKPTCNEGFLRSNPESLTSLTFSSILNTNVAF